MRSRLVVIPLVLFSALITVLAVIGIVYIIQGMDGLLWLT